jgi:hypothetical protein
MTALPTAIQLGVAQVPAVAMIEPGHGGGLGYVQRAKLRSAALSTRTRGCPFVTSAILSSK